VNLLRAHEIDTVVDVRAIPGSRRHPQFGQDRLAAELPQWGIGYVHIPALGGRRRRSTSQPSPNGAWQHPSFRAYADHTHSEAFAAGLRELQALAAERRVATMCAEALWWRCHRRLIADRLTASGWTVCHIEAGGGAARHSLPAFAVVGPDGLVTYPR
jgi:uncharacterized protein (DUF488 family)